MAKKKSENLNVEPLGNGVVEQDAAVSEVAQAPEAKTPAKPKEEKRKIFGVVTDCLKLNIRSRPEANAKILVEVPVLSELEIDKAKSTDKWYKVTTASGISGFCMKKFVAMKR